MTSRMEKVAEDIALTALREAAHTAEPSLAMETLKGAFQARWPVPCSERPMTDAMNAAVEAASSCTGQDAETWRSAVSQAWQPAVQETVEEYFRDARHSFRKGEPMEGAETVAKMVDFSYRLSPAIPEDAVNAAPPPQQCKAAPPGILTREH